MLDHVHKPCNQMRIAGMICSCVLYMESNAVQVCAIYSRLTGDMHLTVNIIKSFSRPDNFLI